MVPLQVHLLFCVFSTCQLMGLAVYNSIILDIHLPKICYRKLLAPSSLPCNRRTVVGVVSVSLHNLDEVMPVSCEEL